MGRPVQQKPLSLGHIEVDSGEFWTTRSLSSSSRSTAGELASKLSRTRTSKSGRRFGIRAGDAGDLWLVFEDAGVTLHDYAFSPTSSGLLEPSDSWRALRRSAEGPAWFRDLARKLLAGAAELHGRGVVHRDLKLSNVAVALGDDGALRVAVIDLSSAWSPAAEASGLFGDFGPSREEETVEYMPPEVLFADADTFYAPAPAYDAWSLGVLLLELLLGTRQALTVDQRTRAVLSWRLRREAPADVERALLRAALADLCIFPGVAACGDDDFAGELQRRDPLEIGYDRFLGVDGVDLLRRLLAHDPRDRLLPADALASHAFFRRDQARACAEFNHWFGWS